jgi:hypothetical protein
VQAGKAKPVAAVVTFAHITGWRPGEILGLKWKNLDFKAGPVRFTVRAIARVCATAVLRPSHADFGTDLGQA